MAYPPRCRNHRHRRRTLATAPRSPPAATEAKSASGMLPRCHRHPLLFVPPSRPRHWGDVPWRACLEPTPCKPGPLLQHLSAPPNKYGKIAAVPSVFRCTILSGARARSHPPRALGAPLSYSSPGAWPAHRARRTGHPGLQLQGSHREHLRHGNIWRSAHHVSVGGWLPPPSHSPNPPRVCASVLACQPCVSALTPVHVSSYLGCAARSM